MATSKVLYVDGEPVVLCFIAWMHDYEGVTEEDIPVWDSAWAKGGYVPVRGKKRATYFLGESTNFIKARDKDGTPTAFGHVQAHFAVKRLGGSDGVAHNVTVVWCAADFPNRNVVKVVGWYRGATVYGAEQPLAEFVHHHDRGKFPDHDGFNLSTAYRNATLLKDKQRPILPVSPGNSELGRWHSQSKNWYGDESQRLVNFLKRLFASEPSSARASSQENEGLPISKRQIVQTVRDRQGQTEFRKSLLAAYRGRCAISGSQTEELLDACHIHPVSKEGATHGLDNGLLLRTDLHTLFDLDLLAIDPRTRKVWVAPSVKDTIYDQVRGKVVAEPAPGYTRPSAERLRRHWLGKRG